MFLRALGAGDRLCSEGDAMKARLRITDRLAPNGDMRGFPPAILITGTRDLLLSSTVRVHRKLRQAGVEAVLQV
jgi:acetyl esterase/lipase